MTLAEGMLYAVGPAAVGAAFAVSQIQAAARKIHDERARSFATVFLAMAGMSIVLALVGAFVASGSVRDLRLQLMVLGGAALLQAGAHGILAARALPDLQRDPTQIRHALVPMAATEIIVIAPLVWILILASGPQVP